MRTVPRSLANRGVPCGATGWVLTAWIAFSLSCDRPNEAQVSEDTARNTGGQSTPMNQEEAMGMQITEEPSGKYVVSLSNAPGWVHTLSAHEPSVEPKLKTGTWLVVVFAVWSSPDINSVHEAVEGLRRHGGSVQLGVRPFERYEEIGECNGGRVPLGPTPLWVMVVDGRVIRTEWGSRNAQEVDRMVAGLEDARDKDARDRL